MNRKLLVVTTEFPRWQDDGSKSDYFYGLCDKLSQFYSIYLVTPHEFCTSKIQKMKRINVLRFQYFWPSKWQILSSGSGMSDALLWRFFRFIQMIFFIPIEIFTLARVIRKYKIDLVMTHNFSPHSVVYSLLKLFLNKPQVIIIDTTDTHLLRKSSVLNRFLIRWVLKSAKSVVLHNAYIRYCLEKITHMSFRHKIIPMGINTLKFTRAPHKTRLRKALGLPRDKKVFFFIGKLTRQQGVNILLEAADLLRVEYHNFVIQILGTGPLEKRIHKWIKKQGMNDIVRFSHIYDKSLLPDYFALCDALIIPSVIDSYGFTDVPTELILKALAAKVTIIASRIADLTFPLKDGYNGWLFEQGKYGSLADKMKLVLNDYSADKIKKNALESIKEYNEQSIADEFYKTINPLIAYI